MKTAKEIGSEISDTHPMNDYPQELENEVFAADALAMELVGERHGKRDLVDLVRYLILTNLNDDLRVLSENYGELIMAVATKFPNESRHETALKYIMQREAGSNNCAAATILK